MADVIISSKTDNLQVSPTFAAYSKVIIDTGRQDENGNDIVYIAGNDTGYTLRMTNPWATQAIADAVLQRIMGFPYKPYVADDAKINPAFELGDSVTINDVYSGIYQHRTKFRRELFTADIQAPCEEEIDYEYTFEDSTERKFTRKLDDAIAQLNFFADSIEAKVDKVSSGSSFGWRLNDNSWSVFNQQGNLFSINSSGAFVKGEIQAGSGKIGGFNIGANGLYHTISSFGSGESSGVYVGINGIQLGSKFRVDAAGNLYASSGNFEGNVYAKNIQYGSSGGNNYGYFSGSGISSQSLGTTQLVSGVVTSLGYANFANDVFNNRDTANYVKAKSVNASNDITATLYYVRGDEEGSGTINRHTHFVEEKNGKVTIGAPDFTGAKHSFNSTGAVVSSTVINGTPTYQSAYRRFAVPVKVTLSNGNTSTTTLYVNAADAYNAGYNAGYAAVDVNWSDGDYDIWIYPYYYDSWEEINGGLAHAKLTNGKERTVRLSW